TALYGASVNHNCASVTKRSTNASRPELSSNSPCTNSRPCASSSRSLVSTVVVGEPTMRSLDTAEQGLSRSRGVLNGRIELGHHRGESGAQERQFTLERVSCESLP